MAGIIVDIDGTLLNGSDPIQRVVDYVNNKSKSYTIYILTSRMESSRADTTKDLRAAGVNYDRLYMRRENQNNVYAKKAHAERILKSNDIVLAIENNLKAKAMYKKLGIKTVSPSSLPSSLAKSSGFFDGLFN
jgi:ribonucleotide monophosphatase NagD (HAD superfamily)